jgi:hypothetical protein
MRNMEYARCVGFLVTKIILALGTNADSAFGAYVLIE